MIEGVGVLVLVLEGLGVLVLVLEVLGVLVLVRVTVGVTEGVTEVVLVGVTDDVIEGVTDGVIDGVTEGVTDAVMEGVTDGVTDGVLEGVLVGVMEGVIEGEVVGESVREVEADGLMGAGQTGGVTGLGLPYFGHSPSAPPPDPVMPVQEREQVVASSQNKPSDVLSDLTQLVSWQLKKQLFALLQCNSTFWQTAVASSVGSMQFSTQLPPPQSGQRTVMS